MYNVVHIVGTRPQFVKLGAVYAPLLAYSNINQIVIASGQHYDYYMKDVFLDDIRVNFDISLNSTNSTKRLIEMTLAITDILKNISADIAIIYGDCDTSLAGLFALKESNIPIVHIEAGVRSFNRQMIEEQNRIVIDRFADVLCAPSQVAIDNLKSEQVKGKVFLTGDVMIDMLLHISNNLSINKRERYALLTLHRRETINHKERLVNIFDALASLPINIIFFTHPHTIKKIKTYNISLPENIKIIDPLPYRDFIAFLYEADIIFTDSGGVQKESYFLKRPCITLRDETEWIETIDSGINVLSGYDRDNIVYCFNKMKDIDTSNIKTDAYGNGDAGSKIAHLITNLLH